MKGPALGTCSCSGQAAADRPNSRAGAFEGNPQPDATWDVEREARAPPSPF